MHAGSIDNPRTAAAKLYGVLKRTRGRWSSGLQLALAIDSTCISTRISEVKRQLPSGEIIEKKLEVHADGKKRWYYRLVVEGSTSDDMPSWARARAGLRDMAVTGGNY